MRAPSLPDPALSALMLIALLLLLPIYWLIMSSFRPAGDIFRYRGHSSASRRSSRQRLTLENYQKIFSAWHSRARCSTRCSSASRPWRSVCSSTRWPGFAFAVFEFPFKKALFVAVLLSFMMPFESIVIPLYTLMRTLAGPTPTRH